MPVFEYPKKQISWTDKTVIREQGTQVQTWHHPSFVCVCVVVVRKGATYDISVNLKSTLCG